MAFRYGKSFALLSFYHLPNELSCGVNWRPKSIYSLVKSIQLSKIYVISCCCTKFHVWWSPMKAETNKKDDGTLDISEPCSLDWKSTMDANKLNRYRHAFIFMCAFIDCFVETLRAFNLPTSDQHTCLYIRFTSQVNEKALTHPKIPRKCEKITHQK